MMTQISDFRKMTAHCLAIGVLCLLSCGGSDEPTSPADTTAPTISINDLNTGNIVTGDLARNLVLSGNSDAENGQTVNIKIGSIANSISISADVNAGTWQSSPVDISNLPDGVLSIEAQVSDAAGNMSITATLNAVLYQNGIEINISTPVAIDDRIVQAESLVLRVDGTSNVTGSQTVSLLFTDGTTTINGTASLINGVWQSTNTNINALNNGDITILATVSDQNGNSSQTITTVTLDKTILPIDPPFFGTNFVSPTISTSNDPSDFMSIQPAGQGIRTMYDRRVNDWTQVNARLFNAEFTDGFSLEVQVNPEFTEAQALEEATFYATELGRLPKVLRRDAETVWIHKGNEVFGGGNNNFLIHTGISENEYIPNGWLNETFIHEGGHTSLDQYIYTNPEWEYARIADGTFISEYARDNPDREDVAESFVMWLAYRYKPNQLTAAQKQQIEASMSYRMAFFDKQNFDLTPLVR